jgi:hypothetical protein
MTALQYKIAGRGIPEHFERGPQNVLEHATNIINPYGYIDAVSSIPGNIKRGEYLQAGLNALTSLPLLSEAKAISSALPALKAETEIGKDVFNEIAAVAETPRLENKIAQTVFDPITGMHTHYNEAGKVIGTSKKLTNTEAKANIQKLLDKTNFRTGATPPPSENMTPKLAWDTDIDWGKWNPEIPQNEDLMNEYINIENSTKFDGTWMKNPDGTPFSGTPEQFIQGRSKNFRKAFPKGADVTYRGDNEHYPELRSKLDKWYGDPIFTANEKLARNYTAKGKNAGYFTPFEPTAEEKFQKYLSDYYPELTKEEFIEKYPYLSRGAMSTEDAGLHQLAIPKTTNKIEIDAKGKPWSNLDDAELNKNIIDAKIKKSIDNKNTAPYLFTTDDVAQYIKKQGIDRALIRNVDDGGFGNVLIHNQRPGNYAKSLRGNNGMFDMNNPNIYKALIPAIGVTGVAAAAGSKDKQKNGGWLNKYK